MKWRYALYDSQAERLLTGDLYRTGSEAAAHRDPRCADVYVVPVSVPGDDPLEDQSVDPHKFSCDVADIDVSFGECASPNHKDTPAELQTYAVTYFDCTLPDGEDEGVLLFQAVDAEDAREQCENASNNYCVTNINRIEGETQQFLVVSYDADQQQWFYDIISTRSADDAKSIVCTRRTSVIDADAQELDTTIESLTLHSPKYRDGIFRR